MHGDQDGTVPYSDNAVTLFGLDVQVYGSYTINEVMNNLGNYSILHTYEGQDHVPFSASNMDFEFEFTSEFLYNIVCSGEDNLLGDINQDEIIDILDIVILINYVLNVETPTINEFNSSDINEDDELNVLDIVLIVDLILDT